MVDSELESFEDVEKCPLLKDFLNYLSYLKEKPAKLTATGNLCRKAIGEISKFIALPRHYIEHGWRLNNQQDWPYFDHLDVLAEVGRFTSKRKGYKRLSPRGREYLGWLPTTQLGELFMSYWENLNWGYLFPFGEDEENNPAVVLRRNHDQVLNIIRIFKRDKDGWIDFHEFAEYVIKEFDLKLINYLGENLPERVRDCIIHVLLEPFFLLGMVEIQGKIYDGKRITELKSFRLTKTGESMISILTAKKQALPLEANLLLKEQCHGSL